MVEASGEEGSIVTDYQYERNTHSDSQFFRDFLDREETLEEPVTVVTDGAYSGEDNEKPAAEKNVELVTTHLSEERISEQQTPGRTTEDARHG